MNAKWLGFSCHILLLYLGVAEKASKCKILGCKVVQKEGSLGKCCLRARDLKKERSRMPSRGGFSVVQKWICVN